MIKIKNKQSKKEDKLRKKEIMKQSLHAMTIADENILAVCMRLIGLEFLYYTGLKDDLFDSCNDEDIIELIADYNKQAKGYYFDFSNIEFAREYKKIKGWLGNSIEKMKELNYNKSSEMLMKRLAKLIQEKEKVRNAEPGEKFFLLSDRDIRFHKFVSTYILIARDMLIDANLNISTIKYIKNVLGRLEGLIMRFESYMRKSENRDILRRDLILDFVRLDEENLDSYYDYLFLLNNYELAEEVNTIRYLKKQKS